MKLALLPSMLCAILVLASSVPVNKNKLREYDSKANSKGFILDHDLSNLPDPIVDSEESSNRKYGGGDVDVDANDLPDNDRSADDNESETSDDVVENRDGIPSDDRETDTRANSNADDTDQPLNHLPNDSEISNDNSTTPKIAATVRIIARHNDVKKGKTTRATLPGLEKQATDETTPPRKRYVKQSTGEYRHHPEHKARKTVTIPVTKKDDSGAKAPKGNDNKATKSNQGRDPPKEKNRSSPNKLPKTPRAPQDSPKDSKTGKKKNVGDPSGGSRSTKRPTSSPRTTNEIVTEENTCPCRIIAKPKMQCYRFSLAGNGACKLRMCGAQWECLKNGTSRNICICKFATEKVMLIPGTHRCRTVRHPPKPYWVFYRRYSGQRGNRGKKVGQA